jgi:hypothetical protein
MAFWLRGKFPRVLPSFGIAQDDTLSLPKGAMPEPFSWKGFVRLLHVSQTIAATPAGAGQPHPVPPFLRKRLGHVTHVRIFAHPLNKIITIASKTEG